MMKAKTRAQIAVEYGISPRTLRRWFLKSKLKVPSGLLKPNTLRSIYDAFGNPVNSED